MTTDKTCVYDFAFSLLFKVLHGFCRVQTGPGPCLEVQRLLCRVRQGLRGTAEEEGPDVWAREQVLYGDLRGLRQGDPVHRQGHQPMHEGGLEGPTCLPACGHQGAGETLRAGEGAKCSEEDEAVEGHRPEEAVPGVLEEPDCADDAAANFSGVIDCSVALTS